MDCEIAQGYEVKCEGCRIAKHGCVLMWFQTDITFWEKRVGLVL